MIADCKYNRSRKSLQFDRLNIGKPHRMDKLKVYLTKNHRSHNRGTLEQLKQRIVKSKSQACDSKNNIKNYSHGDLLKMSATKPNTKAKPHHTRHNRSLQHLQDLEARPACVSRYATKEKEARDRRYDSQKSGKVLSSNVISGYVSEKTVEAIKRRINNSQVHLNYSVYNTSSMGFSVRPHEARLSAQTPDNMKNAAANQKLPAKKRSKSAQPNQNNDKKQIKNNRQKRPSSLKKAEKNQSDLQIKNQAPKNVLKHFKSSGRTRKGVQITNPNKVNQDRFYIEENFATDEHSELSLYIVADGHGPYGHLVSQRAIDCLPARFRSHLQAKKGIGSSINKAYSDIQTSLERGCDFSADLSGSTLVSVIVENSRKITCANVGDSRAILARQLSRKDWEVIRLSNDHKPSLPQQRKRILAKGGRVQTVYDQMGKSIGPQRVWLPKKQVQGLAMSRSIGDNVSKPIGVTHEPQILTHHIEEGDKFIIIASDGVWQFLSNFEILKIILPFYRQNRLQDACEALMHHAYDSWTVEDHSIVDDITFIVIFLSDKQTHNEDQQIAQIQTKQWRLRAYEQEGDGGPEPKQSISRTNAQCQ